MLRLTRRIGERTLPAWQSLGRMSPGGLVPERFSLQMRGGDRQATTSTAMRAAQLRPAPAAGPADGAQDRLSWWLQLAGLAGRRAGACLVRWRVWVAGLRGELREWVFELVEGGQRHPWPGHLVAPAAWGRGPGLEVGSTPRAATARCVCARATPSAGASKYGLKARELLPNS